MRLYRYELFCDEEPQDVGFIVGLDDLGLSAEQEEHLLALFDKNLEIPNIPQRNTLCFFTEYGNHRFKNAIDALVDAYYGSIFDVKCCILDFPDACFDDILYQDEDQVCISCDLYRNLKNNQGENYEIQIGTIG